jgi:hypothetical protein
MDTEDAMSKAKKTLPSRKRGRNAAAGAPSSKPLSDEELDHASGAGTAQHAEITVTKLVDKATPKLFS